MAKPKILSDEEVVALRRKVALRDEFRCVLCGTEATSIHHIQYRSKAAKNSETVWNMANMVCLCRKCHHECHQHPQESRQRLLERMMNRYGGSYAEKILRVFHDVEKGTAFSPRGEVT